MVRDEGRDHRGPLRKKRNCPGGKVTGEAATLETVLGLADQLSVVDEVRLIGRLAPRIERELKAIQPAPRKSLRGLWQGLDITEEEIAEARREMWANFPREDI